MNATTNVSCEGTDNFPYATSDVFDPTVYGDTLTAVDSNSFSYSGDIFRRIPGTNSFAGTFQYNDGMIGQVRFEVVSPSQMTGYITVNYDIDGTPCSETVVFVSSRG
jgi:hypothetical protein